VWRRNSAALGPETNRFRVNLRIHGNFVSGPEMTSFFRGVKSYGFSMPILFRGVEPCQNILESLRVCSLATFRKGAFYLRFRVFRATVSDKVQPF